MMKFSGVLIPLLLIAQTNSSAEKSLRELKKLQGEWTLIRSVRDGQEVPRDRLKNLARHTIEGDRWIPGRDPNDFTTISFNPESKPKSVDMKDRAGNVMVGIYEIQGDTLTICIARRGTPRPKILESAAGSNTFLIGLKRVQTPK